MSTRFGSISVWMFVVGYALIIVAGLLALLLRTDDSPIFLLFPIGGLLMDLGALFTGIAVARAGNWSGWQRFMPLIYALYLWIAIEIPSIAELYADEPGLVPELGQALGLFLVALAVYSAQPEEYS